MARFKQPIQGLQNAINPASVDQLGSNIGLEDRGIEAARSGYRDMLNQDFYDPTGVGQAVHMAQRAQATMPGDPQGMRAFTQALAERHATIPGKGSGLDLPSSPSGLPSTIFDPVSQTSAVDPAANVAHRAALDKAIHPEYYQPMPSTQATPTNPANQTGSVNGRDYSPYSQRRATNPALDALKGYFNNAS